MLDLVNVMPLILLGLSAFYFWMGRAKANRLIQQSSARLHSRPAFHGLLGMLWMLLAGLFLYVLILIVGNWMINGTLLAQIRAADPTLLTIRAHLVLSDAKALAAGHIASSDDALRQIIALGYVRLNYRLDLLLIFIPLVAILVLGGWHYRQIALDWRARNHAEAMLKSLLFACAVVAILTTIGIVLSLVFETLNFFSTIGWRVDKYLFGTNWTPLAGVHKGQLDPDRVGAVPLFVGTFLITLVAMSVAVPIGLFAAIYLSDFASATTRAWVKPILEILAGIPTVVYGFFAAITLAPAIRGWGEAIGLSVASESALAAGAVMGIMIIPFISSLSDDVINAVPQSLRDGSYGLGATKAETIRHVVLPAALPGIVSAILLGVSRAVGETMIVVMAAGQGANLTLNPFEAVTTVTVQIVMLITGDTEASTAAGPAFTLGFTLFCVTLLLNVVALRIVRKYREAYE